MIAFVMFLVVFGSIVFHLLSPWWWTPIASNWGGIDSILQLTFALTGFVFAAVIGFMIYFLLLFFFYTKLMFCRLNIQPSLIILLT